jgi:predicted nuclease of predicted toxin-antitoxin system
LKVLLDHNLPKALRRLLSGHDVRTTRRQGWEGLANGLLLRAAADDEFDRLLTVDKNMEYQQNLRKLPIAIVQLDAPSSAIGRLIPFLPATLALLSAPLAPALYVIAADGTVTLVTDPRPKP